jgi:sugar-specific transcriptional regulator TrmB
MDNKALLKLGMNEKEVKVYMKLLELGHSGANSLSKRIGENRTSTYSLLQSMQKKGFVSFIIKKDIKYFTATDPTSLVNHYFENAKFLKKILPELLAMHNKSGQKPKITFYEGVEGIKQIGEILLEVPGSTRYSFMGANEKTMHPEIKRYYEEDFVNRRIALGIKYIGIVTGKLPMATNYAHNDKAHLRELKYIDPKKFPIKIHIDIFPNNKVALYSYDKDEQMGVVIEHEAFYTTMKTVFQLAWVAV